MSSRRNQDYSWIPSSLLQDFSTSDLRLLQGHLKTVSQILQDYLSDFKQTGFMEPSSTVDIWHSNICPSDVCPGDNYKLADLTLQAQRLIQVIFRDNFKHDFNTTKLSST